MLFVKDISKCGSQPEQKSVVIRRHSAHSRVVRSAKPRAKKLGAEKVGVAVDTYRSLADTSARKGSQLFLFAADNLTTWDSRLSLTDT